MAKITRQTFLQFGKNANPATDIGVFGSLAAGSPTFSGVISTIQSLAAWLTGWTAATIATNRPALEDMMAIQYVYAYMIAYLFQAGIAEYDAGSTYYIGSVVMVGSIPYVSLTDNNIGNTPASSPSNWQKGIPEAELSGVIKQYAGSVAPNGYLFCDGSAVSRATYVALFSICSTTYGPGDGSTTFNLPDLRARFPAGYKSGDADFGTLGQTGGSKTKNIQHVHNLQGDGASLGSVDTANQTSKIRISGGQLFGINTGAQSAEGVTTTTTNGGSTTQDVLNPYLTLNYIIKT